MDKNFNINEISFDISSLATQAILYEVSCFPSPGLVSPISNGAHKDMNYYTFIDSTCSLMKYLTLFIQLGISFNGDEKNLFNNLRQIGIKAENDMFIKTKGINTHKGMLFLIGVTCAAIGRAINLKKDFQEIRLIIKSMTEGIVEKELVKIKNKDKLSYGEELFLKYGIKGIREEVENGLPTIFNFSLNFYLQNEDLDLNSRLIQTLLGIMQFCEDGNILHRHDLQTLYKVQHEAKYIIKLGGMRTKKGKIEIEKLCQIFIEKNISPGGSADLLGLTIFLSMVKDYMSKL